jgi:hypothetical protein
MSKLSANWRTITDVPPALVDVIWFNPGIWPN